ncbi:MAG: hypothetical protein WCD49_15370 [Candidatus Acidiferrales bacterium]
MSRVVLVCLAVLLIASAAFSQTNSSWNGGTGTWNTAGSWTPSGVPNNGGGNTYNVTIDSGGTDNVTLNISPTINLLNIGGASGGSAFLGDASGSPETLTILGALTVNNTGELALVNGSKASAGSVTVNGSGFIDLQNTGSSLSVSGNLTNSGTVATDIFCCGTGASLTVTGSFTNNAGATFDVGSNNAPANDTDSVGTLVNNGTVRVGTGSTLNLTNQVNGITDIAVGSTILNGGTISAGSNNAFYKLATMEGELQLSNGKSTADTATTLTLSSAGFLDIQSGSSFSVANITNSGTVATDIFCCSTGASLTVSGTFTNNAGGIFDVGTNNAPANDTDNVGTLVNNGELQIGTGSTLNLTNQVNGITDVAAGSQILNAGTIAAGSNNAFYKLATIEGTLRLQNGKATADTVTTLTLSSSGFLSMENGSSFTVASISNSGTVATDLFCCGTGSSLTVSGTFTNNAGGTFDVGTNNEPANDTDNVGTLVNNGTVNIGTGSTLNLSNQSNGITDIAAGSAIINSGTVSAGSNNAFYKLATMEGELELANGKLTADTVSTLTLSSGGFLVLQGTAGMSPVGSSFTVASISNSGTVATDLFCCGTGSSLTVSGTFTNNAGGTFDVGTNNEPANDTDSVGTLMNNGLVNIGTGSTLNLTNQPNGITSIATGSEIINSGTISAGSNNAFYQLATMAGELELANGKLTADTVSTLALTSGGFLVIQNGSSFTVANITNGSGATVATDLFCCSSGSSLTVSGTFTNNGTFDVGTNNVPANDTDSVGTLVNTGLLQVGTGSTLNLTNQSNGITDIAAGSEILNAGTISAGSNNAFYKLATIEGTLRLQNGKATADTATALTLSSSGFLSVEDGSSFTVANITNSGTVATDIFCCGTGSSLTVSGTFTNNSGATFDVGTNDVPANDSDSVGVLVNTGTVNIGWGSTLTLATAGTSTNNGTINVGNTSGPASLKIDGNTTLTGTTGKVILSNFAGNIIGGTGTLTNVKNTISGSGNIGNGTIGLNNQGTIDADQSVPLIINATSVSNSGTLEATVGATLQLDAGTYTQTSAGNILATETGNALSAVNLESGVTINGGKLTITGTTATINLVGTNPTLTLNGVTISGSGKLVLPDGSTTTLLGTNSNTSTIDLNSTGDQTKLVVGSTSPTSVTLNGTGKIILATNGDDIITGATSTDVLHNLNTIEGPGNIGDGNLGLVNSGVIETVTKLGELEIDASNAGFTNQGTVEAVAGTTLYIDNGSNQFTNFNSSTDTLTGGVFVVDGILKFDGANITTDAANITLSGAAAKIENFTDGNAITNLNTIATGGIFDIISQSFTTSTAAGNFTVNGTLDVGSGAKFIVNSTDSLTNFSGTTLTGGAFNVTGTLEFAGANIVNNDASITLTGTKALIENSTNSANALAGFDNNESGGTFALATKANFTTAGTFTNSGTLNIGSGSTFAVGTGGTGTLTNFSGSTLTGGTYIVAGTLQFDGANIVTNAANITLSGTTPLIKDQNGNNALANFATNSSSGSFTLTSDAKITTAGAFSNAGSVLINKGSTFTVGGNANYTQTAGSTTVNGSLTLGSAASVNISGGDLFGDAGTITGSVNASGSAIVDPGDGIGGLGDIKVTQNYTQASTASLDIDLGGTAANTLYDVLDVTGNAGLGGTLNVDLVNGYAPKVNASFTILNYGSDTTDSEFSAVNLPTVSGDHWTVTYNMKDLVIKLVAGPGPNVVVDDLTSASSSSAATGTVTASPARRVSRISLAGASASNKQEPVAILSRVTCFAARLIGSDSCDKASTVAASHGSELHATSSVISTGSAAPHNNIAAHNNVMVATRSISAAQGGASHETSASASAMARLYMCAYLPSTVGHTMGCN